MWFTCRGLLPHEGKARKRENDDDDVDGGVIGRRLRYRLAAVATDMFLAWYVCACVPVNDGKEESCN